MLPTRERYSHVSVICISPSSIRAVQMQRHPPAHCSHQERTRYHFKDTGFAVNSCSVDLRAQSSTKKVTDSCWSLALSQRWLSGFQQLGKQRTTLVFNVAQTSRTLCFLPSLPSLLHTCSQESGYILGDSCQSISVTKMLKELVHP